jgi:hypothetical protein
MSRDRIPWIIVGVIWLSIAGLAIIPRIFGKEITEAILMVVWVIWIVSGISILYLNYQKRRKTQK